MDGTARAEAGRRFASRRDTLRAARPDAIERACVAAGAAIAWLPANLAALTIATDAAAHGTASRDRTRRRAATDSTVATQAAKVRHAFAPGACLRPARRKAGPGVAKRMPLPCFICLAHLDAGRHAACQYASRRAISASRCAGSTNDASKPLRITALTSASVSCSPATVAK